MKSLQFFVHVWAWSVLTEMWLHGSSLLLARPFLFRSVEFVFEFPPLPPLLFLIVLQDNFNLGMGMGLGLGIKRWSILFMILLQCSFFHLVIFSMNCQNYVSNLTEIYSIISKCMVSNFFTFSFTPVDVKMPYLKLHLLVCCYFMDGLCESFSIHPLFLHKFYCYAWFLISI